MLAEYRASYSHKFDSPFTAFLHTVTMDNGNLPQFGSATEGPGSIVHVGGRHVLVTQTDGYVQSFRMERGDDFDKYVAEQFPSLYAFSVWVHDESRDGSGCTWCGAYAQVDSNNLCADCFEDA